MLGAGDLRGTGGLPGVTPAHPLYADLSRYIQESERIRQELRDTIFTADYFDVLDATVTEVQAAAHSAGSPVPATGPLHWRVHGNRETGRRAIVVVNASREPQTYTWAFQHKTVATASLYEPFQTVRQTQQSDAVTIPGERFQVIVE